MQESQRTVILPTRFLQEQRLAETNLLAKLVAHWGEVPVPLVQLLSPDKSLYGFVGLEDNTLFPIIRPGSSRLM